MKIANATMATLVTIPEQGGYGMTAIDLASSRHGFAVSGYYSPLAMPGLAPYPDAPILIGSTTAPADIQANRAMGNQLGYLWGKDNAAGTPDSLFFEGDWFRAEGFARVEDGFPQALSSPPVTHPGVNEFDGDPEMEIFFADSAGYVHVLNHDGSEVPGWPVYVGQVPVGSAVAGGDIDADGEAELVVGTSNGIVRAYDWGGVVKPGYPIDLGTGQPVYVSIGPLWSVPEGWQLVAVSGNEVHAFSFGAEMPGFPLVKPANVVGPAAIGDLDMDGYAEIVTALTNAVHVDRYDGSPLLVRSFAADPPFGPVAIAEFDGDEDLDREIAVSSTTGKVTLMHHTGEDLPGWPRMLDGPALPPIAVHLRGYGFDPPHAGRAARERPRVHAGDGRLHAAVLAPDRRGGVRSRGAGDRGRGRRRPQGAGGRTRRQRLRLGSVGRQHDRVADRSRRALHALAGQLGPGQRYEPGGGVPHALRDHDHGRQRMGRRR